jgi:anti-sigma factor RsiW
VFDFGMMGYTLTGGRVGRLENRSGAVFAYRGAAGDAIVCVMYAGSLAELPAGAEPREHNGIRFQVYRRDGFTLVFWEEGEIVCVLISAGPPEQAIELAYAKAVKAS